MIAEAAWISSQKEQVLKWLPPALLTMAVLSRPALPGHCSKSSLMFGVANRQCAGDRGQRLQFSTLTAEASCCGIVSVKCLDW